MKTITGIWAVAAAVSLAGITGCAAQNGDSSPSPVASSAAPSAGNPAQTEGVITIRDFKYEVPDSVKPGAMVTVTNADSAPHTVTAKDEGGFDVEVPGGATVIFQAPDAPGEYGIICTFHPQMNGTLVVK
ncbi:cupredoxin domain-containing protein [Arthrobacter sp. MPF02]|uniref:cupredoxin domain-containing protein n=1 Tax=Arthrobacter sp. MPF02 TaxID=3388492 RepID=UPI0039852A0C